MGKTNQPPEVVTLEATLTTIRRRWGVNAICKLPAMPPVAILPTGFPPLDAALGLGGIPRGRLITLQGTPTSGMMTLALSMARMAQASGELVALVNLSCQLDPAYVSRCGLDLSQVLVVLPKTEQQGLDISHDLVASRGVGFILFNGTAALALNDHHQRFFHRLAILLRKSALAWVGILNQPIGLAAAAHPPLRAADVLMQVEKERWLGSDETFNGYETRVTVIKNKGAPATQGRTVTLPIAVNYDSEGL